MRALIYLVLMLGSLLGGTAQVLAGELRLADEVLDQLPGNDHCLNDPGLLNDLPPLPSDNESRPLVAETVVMLSIRAVLDTAFVVSAPVAAALFSYPIRAPPSSVA
ncbi:hypothetical protein KQ940_06480 [Marinobacterium sp. D7]|uniref:hypothetical protein n=1 Tax=Marinobacterium ramblicola TaxID=2849041 RepID=UPI001C2CFFFE|nr:hypothetical protein [Marinobacterium ramblicola]MBV1787699.1 hypothetical protein [Marinobacterium ramblicola]